MAVDAGNTIDAVIAREDEQQRATDDQHDTNGAPHAPSGYERLLQTPYRYEFDQALLLLDRYMASDSNGRKPRVSIRPHPALRFPATDVIGIELDPNATQANMTVAFLGLYGVDSLLPSFIAEAANADTDSGKRLREFLDLFNSRFYWFFHRAWVRSRHDLADDAQQVTLAVAGLGTPGALKDHPAPIDSLISLAGRLGNRIRTAGGLQEIVERLLKSPVRIEQNVERRVRLTDRPALGRTFELGSRATVGSQILDRSGKFRIHVGPVHLDRFLDLQPGTASSRALSWITRMYAPDYLDYDVAVHVRTETLRPVALGDRSSRLGVTASLGIPAAAVVTRIVRYE